MRFSIQRTSWIWSCMAGLSLFCASSPALNAPETPTATPIIATPGPETPADTPVPALTATPTSTQTPEIVHGVFPSVRFVKTQAWLTKVDDLEDCMAADPSSGDLYVLSLRRQRKEFALRVYDAKTLAQKDGYNVAPPDDFHESIMGFFEFMYGMAMDSNGAIYLSTRTVYGNYKWILRLNKGEKKFEVLRYLSSRSYSPAVALLPVEEPNLPSGVPGAGLLYMAELDDTLQFGLFFYDPSNPNPPDRQIAVLPNRSSRQRNNRMIVGPNRRIYILDNANIYRMESDNSLTEKVGMNSHFSVPYYTLTDLVFDSIHGCFFMTDAPGNLFQTVDDFQQVVKIGDYLDKIRWKEIEISPQTGAVLVSGIDADDNSLTRNDWLYRLESNSPLPAPTNTPTPRPPISTFRPIVYPVDPAGNPVAIVPYANLRLVTQSHRDICALGVDPLANDLYYFYYEYLPASWTDKRRSEKLIATFRGPINANEGYTSLSQQPVFGKFEGSMPFEKPLIVTPNRTIFLANYQTVRIINDSRMDVIPLYTDELLYVRPDCHFLDVPAGSILWYHCNSGETGAARHRFGYFDPTRKDVQSHPLSLPEETIEQLNKVQWIYHLFWGPNGNLCAQNGHSIYRFDPSGAFPLIYTVTYGSNPYGFCYLSQDRSFYYHSFSAQAYGQTFLFRLPENSDNPQPVLTLNQYSQFLFSVSGDGSKLYFVNKQDQKIWEFAPHFIPGLPVVTPTPTTPPGTPTPTPTPVDWMMLDGFGGIHISRPEVKRPDLPYFYNFDIVRDLEPDPLGRGWYMLDGFGGVHTSSPDLPRPVGLPYFWQQDVARDLEILEKDGQLTFVMMDGYGCLHVSGPNAGEVSLDAPVFGIPMARALEPAPASNTWLVMDAYGALYDSRDHSVSVAAGAYWRDAWFARALAVFPDDVKLMVDSMGGRHYREGQSPLSRLYPIPDDLYFWGWEIVWDFEIVRE